MTFICPDCQVELRMIRAGAVVETMMVDGPYHLVSSDIWCCPGCGKRIFHLAERPIAEHFQPEYTESRKRLKPSLRAWKNTLEKEQYDKRFHEVPQ